MRVMSTLKTVWTCGLVCLDSTMRLAMIERILVMGTSSPSCCTPAAALAGDDVAAADCTAESDAEMADEPAAPALWTCVAVWAGLCSDPAAAAAMPGVVGCPADLLGLSMWPRMSVLVMRPLAPVPATCCRSTLLSGGDLAHQRATSAEPRGTRREAA